MDKLEYEISKEMTSNIKVVGKVDFKTIKNKYMFIISAASLNVISDCLDM